VLDLLVADESNPRSLAFQLAALAEHAANLPHDAAGNGESREAAQIAALRKFIEQGDLLALAEGQLTKKTGELSAWLAHIATDLRGISDRLMHHYFSHADTRVS
jgi:uncharacterized alpha-E superfamily protein